MHYYYPNTETVKRGPYMDSPIGTLKWEFRKIPFTEMYPSLDQEAISIKIEEDFYLENYSYNRGDSIYIFNTPSSYWDSLIGRDGMALYRKQEIMSVVTGRQN